MNSKTRLGMAVISRKSKYKKGTNSRPSPFKRSYFKFKDKEYCKLGWFVYQPPAT